MARSTENHQSQTRFNTSDPQSDFARWLKLVESVGRNRFMVKQLQPPFGRLGDGGQW
jgi:hypothetical protein